LYLKLLLFVSLFFIFGCEDKTLVKIYDSQSIGAKIDSLSLFVNDEKIRAIAIDAIKSENISLSDKSDYLLQVDARAYRHHCDNPSTPAYEATYDGYARIKLLKNLKPIFMAQKDYHGKLNSSILSSLIEKLVDEMKIKIVPKSM